MLTIVINPVFGTEAEIQNLNAVIPTPQVYTIFWGSYWTQGIGVSQATQLADAASKLMSSSFLQVTAQYGTGGTATFGYPLSISPNSQGDPTSGFSSTTLYAIDYSLAHSGQLPNGTEASPTAIFVIVTPPGILSDQNTAAVGYNNSLFNHSLDDVDYPTIWCSSGNLDGSTPAGGVVNVDAFSKILSHEMAEIMTDLGGGGFRVNPGSGWTGPTANQNQIADYEPNGYQYRESNGAMVQPVWSRATQKFIVTDGNMQNFVLNPVGYTGNAAAQKYDLVLDGDQPGHSDDVFYIDTISTPNGDEVKAVINSEVAIFEPNAIRSITINTRNGTNTVFVARTVASVTINGNGNDTVNLGVGGSLQGINADVDIFGTVSKINLDDSSDPTNLQPAIGSGVISSLLPNSHNILFPYGLDGANESLTLDTGSGTSAVDIFDTIAGGSVTLNTVQGTSAINVRYLSAGGPLTVNLGGGAQNVNISPTTKDLSTTLFADVTINPGTGTSTLSIDDDNATVARRWTINAGSVSTDIAGAGVIHFGRVDDVRLSDGAHGNVFTVQNTLNGLATDIYADSGDTVNVLGTALGSTVNLSGPFLMVNVGNNGRMTNLHGLLYVGGVGCSMTVDDSNDVLGQNNVTIGATSITGLGDGVISNGDGALNTTTIIGSGGGSTYHVLGVPTYQSSSTTTLTCEGTDTVLVGDNGSLAGVQSNLVVNNPSKFTNLTIDASADNSLAGSYAAITNSHVSGLAIGDIRFDETALSALTIFGVSGGAPDYVVYGLPSNSLFTITTTLNLRAGDTLEFGRNYSLQGDWGSGNLVCNFGGSGPTTHVVLDGNQDPAGAVYTIGGNNNLTINNAAVGLGLAVNGFRDQDQIVVDLPGGTVNADLTQTSRGTIVLDGSARLAGTNLRSLLNVTAHARAGAVVAMPTGPDSSVARAFNLVELLGSMPQDSLHVYDSTNAIAVANDPIQSPYAQFAAAAGDPTTVTAGQPFDFTIVAQDASGTTLTNYANQVQWYAYNRATGDYTSSNYEPFTPADQGQHVFHNVLLPSAGTYSLGFDDGWNVSSFTINVAPPGHMPAGGQATEADAAPIDVSAAARADPAAVTSDTMASTPPVDALVGNIAVASDPVANMSLVDNSVVALAVQSPSVETAPQQTAEAPTPPVNGPSGGAMIDGLSGQKDELTPPHTGAAQSGGPISTDVARQPLPDVRILAMYYAIDSRMNPGGSSDSILFRSTQPVVVVQSPANDAVAALSRNSTSSEGVGSARFETRDVPRASGPRAAVIRSDSSLTPSIASVWNDALDEWFAKYDSQIASSRGSSCVSEM